MYYLPTSCLIFLFLVFVSYPLPCASSKQEHGWCEALFQCGNITAGFPFWGGNRHEHCGHPSLKLHCNKNNSATLIILDQEYSVLHLNHTSYTLTLARRDHLGSFCSSNFTNIILPPNIFELSSIYENLTVFYQCESFHPYLPSDTCPKKGFISVSDNPGYHETCHDNFTVNVPNRFVTEEKERDVAHLEIALKEGFEVKVKIDEKACENCLSSHRRCGFNEYLPSEVKCGPFPPHTGQFLTLKSPLLSLSSLDLVLRLFTIPLSLCLFKPLPLLSLTQTKRRTHTIHRPKKIMYYLPTSSLVIFFLFSLFHYLPCSSSKLELCDETLFQCGKITARFPFWGGNRQKHCGHPLPKLQYNMDITSIFISNQEFIVIHLNQTSNTLTLARRDNRLGSFCSSVFTNSNLPPEVFEVMPTYKSLTIFYHCDPSLPYLLINKCPEKGLILVSENHGYHETCPSNFTMNVPKSFVQKQRDWNLTHLESALKEGFEVKVKIDEKACQKCLSSHERCGFNESFPFKCGPLPPPTGQFLTHHYRFE
ncbi:unnamed protein product [Thlaspi arvense]|uniref:non-specific serine/threonine protein kinase n=1 Tax=Thlaspi arvense TaxID=13288 RepID=A0AAU9SKI8_THLAR|nr:unnamed protein product [Thlaspi arvense]